MRISQKPAHPAALLALVMISSGCGSKDASPPAAGDGAEPSEELSGGDTTVFDTSQNAFSLSARNMTQERRSAFYVGNSFFKENWVIAPSSTEGRDGLGPLYNARSCSGCHFMDGRGKPSEDPSEPLLSVLVRLSIPGKDAHGGALPEPTYGGQVQPDAISGIMAEGGVFVAFSDVTGQFDDGELYVLKSPTYSFALTRGAMVPDTLRSPRVAPQMVGLGLLEAIAEKDVLAGEDPDDKNADGISGRANWVWDQTKQTKALGRFGWKANQPSLSQQTMGAFLGDMGITTPLFPNNECSPAEADCAAAPNGGSPEASETVVARVTFYSTTLAVPARRDWQDETVLAGKALFRSAGCAGCHTPRFETGELAEYPELSGQTIWPYSDLLLHDMGEALADGRPDFEADGREWRTPPLWGIGLFQVVNGHTRLLHDGRARDATEAILWHGGEAEASAEAFRAMDKQNREALLRFLGSL